MTVTQFLEVTRRDDTQEKTQQVSLLICAKTGRIATQAAFELTFTDFGGSADIVAGQRLVKSSEILLREVREEAGALVKLLGQIKEKPINNQTDIEIGGPYNITVADHYSEAVSSRAVELATLRNILFRAKSDGDEVERFALVLLPDLEPHLSESQIRDRPNNWFASSSDKERRGLTRIGQKIYESIDYPLTWKA